MYMKNERLIINEDILEKDIKILENKLIEFFAEDDRFSKYNIGVFIDLEMECCNEYTDIFWNSVEIRIVNYDKIIELGGIYKGEKRFAMATIQFTTDGIMPSLVMENGEPKFYYVFDFCGNGITNSVTWENNSKKETVEDIVLNFIFKS